jgi:hypothetical protein
MKWLLPILALLLTVPACLATDSLTPCEVDGVTQTGRVIMFGRVFADGEIASYPQPLVGGSALGSTSWQADVKNRWPDGSVKFAVISLITTLSSGTCATVTFQNNASGNNTGYIGTGTSPSFATFNSGNWDAQLVVTPGSGTSGAAAVTVSAKSMLALSDPASNSFGDCKNDYWLQGPVVTEVIVQDCTSSSASDFGWNWNGTNMASDGTHASYTGNNSFASFHPMFILAFVPSTNSVMCEEIIEIPWSGRLQDQEASIVYKTDDSGGTLQTRYTYASALVIGRTRHRKVFWSGTAPGHIRVGYNWAYLISTKAYPYYDPAAFVSPDNGEPGNGSNYGLSYAQWAATDQGDIGGNNGWSQDYSSNDEGAPQQRDELAWLYNMDAVGCKSANSACAKAWDMLTGEVDANASTTLSGVAGGAGAWNNLGNVPFHMRESRTTPSGGNLTTANCFYVSAFENKNAAGNVTTSTCTGAGDGNVADPTGPNVATGKALSRHAHSDYQQTTAIYPVTAVGNVQNPPGGWDWSDCSHWLDYGYTPYLLTGSPYFLEEEYFSASACSGAVNPAANAVYTSNGIFAYGNPTGAELRTLAWNMQVNGRAGFIAPDGSAEQAYYTSVTNSDLEIEEGAMGLTGSSLTPMTTNCSGSSYGSYNSLSANRWDWGRCTIISNCTPTTASSCTIIPTALHMPAAGQCPVTGSGANDVNASVASAFMGSFQFSDLMVAAGELQELGFLASKVNGEIFQSLEERTLNGSYNPYLIALGYLGMRAGASSCPDGQNTDPYISSYATLLTATTSTTRSAANFNSASFPDYTNFPCADHGYSLLARASASFFQELGIPNALTAWTWVSAQVPYFNNSPPVSTGCGTLEGNPLYDGQIKWALTARPAVPSGPTGTPTGKLPMAITANAPAVVQTGQSQAFTAACTPGPCPTVTWGANGGTINSGTGVWTAPTATGTYEITASAEGAIPASFAVSVVAVATPPPPIPAENVTVSLPAGATLMTSPAVSPNGSLYTLPFNSSGYTFTFFAPPVTTMTPPNFTDQFSYQESFPIPATRTCTCTFVWNTKQNKYSGTCSCR